MTYTQYNKNILNKPNSFLYIDKTIYAIVHTTSQSMLLSSNRIALISGRSGTNCIVIPKITHSNPHSTHDPLGTFEYGQAKF